MNNLNFKTPGGFPLSTNILDAMQTAYMVFNALGNIAGNFAIISGCTESGSQVSDGVVFINGELVEFRGGGVSSTVTIKEDVETRVFENGSTNPVIYKRYATFGSSTPDKTFNWADFKRIFPTTAIEPFKADFEKRISELEKKKSDVPSGVVLRYDQPLIVLPPEGWVDFDPANERGHVWVGYDTNDNDFIFGNTGGEKEHTLKPQELPPLKFKIPISPNGSSAGDSMYGRGGVGTEKEYTVNNGTASPHNNLQPYVSVRYIKKL